MLDLSTISEEVLLARGQYATVRGAHENAKKEMAGLCGQLQTNAGQILRKMQPDEGGPPDGVIDLLMGCRALLDKMDICVTLLDSLAKQRAELRKTAWAKS